jgi:hypothetical protein
LAIYIEFSERGVIKEGIKPLVNDFCSELGSNIFKLINQKINNPALWLKNSAF